MTNGQIINQILETKGGEKAMLITAFNNCYVGTTTVEPIRVVYDYWKCLDYLVNNDNWDFDEAVDYLEEIAELPIGENAPLYVKQI